MYAVFDANNFYVSCERVVNPKLRGIPVVVANPGGIVLARSNEAKELGIGMAAPLFKIQEEIKQFGIHVASTRFSLYTDLSTRIATILHELFPKVEEYSIDESFVFLPDNTPIAELEAQCVKARERIQSWTGVPVSVGISTTKTLAKVAVKLAKKSVSGVMSIAADTFREEVLRTFPIGDLWGIGRALSAKLPAYGINTALELSQQDPIEMRRKFSVVLGYTIQELKGVSCFTVETAPKPAKSLMCTESYHEAIGESEVLLERLRALSVRAGVQLCKQREVAGGMGVFVRGDRFHKERGFLALQEMTTFAPPTANTPTLTTFVEDSLVKLFAPGALIKRAGVFLFDLMPEAHRQYGLFENPDQQKIEKDDRAMKAIDSIERKWRQKKRTFLEIKV